MDKKSLVNSAPLQLPLGDKASHGMKVTAWQSNADWISYLGRRSSSLFTHPGTDHAMISIIEIRRG